MAKELKSGLFYEILLRGNWGNMPGELGSFCGAHYMEGDAIVDTDTGKVISYSPGQAENIEPDKVAQYLGEKLTQWIPQAQNMSATIASLQETVRLQAAEIASMQETISTGNKLKDSLQDTVGQQAVVIKSLQDAAIATAS